LCRAYNWN